MDSKILQSNIAVCKKTRQVAAQSFLDVCKTQGVLAKSEKQLAENWAKQLSSNNTIHASGWYVPPPLGVGILFGQPPDFFRTKYDNLRKKEFSPKDNEIFGSESVGMIYSSPVNKQAGIMGDFGLTIYAGNNLKIQQHIKTSLDIVKKTAEFAQVGMEFREVNKYSQNLLTQNGLNNDRTVAYTAKVSKSIGHTIPFTYEQPNEKEQTIIDGQNIDELKELLRTKRINLDAEEKFKIPSNIAFTTEIRAESNINKNLPSAFFHIIVAFTDGKKEIFVNFDEIFRVLKMDYIKSR